MDLYMIVRRIVHIFSGVFWGGQLGREMTASGAPPTPGQMTEMQALSAKLERGVYLTAYLLIVALLGMAIARTSNGRDVG